MPDDITIAGNFFRCGNDLESISLELTNRTHNAAVMARLIRDSAVHGSLQTGDSSIDHDEIAAMAEVLLSYFGRIDPLVDQLEKLANDACNARFAAERAASQA